MILGYVVYQYCFPIINYNYQNHNAQTNQNIDILTISSSYLKNHNLLSQSGMKTSYINKVSTLMCVYNGQMVCLTVCQIIMQERQQEEGFFTEHIEIKEASAYNCKSPALISKSRFSLSPFETKVLPWTGAFKKEPVEVQTVNLACMSHGSQPNERKKNKPSSKDHPYKLYASNPNYQLVYSRTNGQPISNEPAFIKNEVKLQHLGKDDVANFKKIKSFQETDELTKPGILKLDSKFECGNLHCAYKNEKGQEYILFIENDTNSLGYNQWFYFSVRNNSANTKYTFRLVNFKKKHSFFKYGSKPAIFSMARYNREGNGWSRGGNNVVYEQSPIHIPEYPENKFYSLSFDLTIQQEDDYMLIAMGLPYSYSKLISFLKDTQAIARTSPSLEFNIKSISRTICGNDVPQVTITRKSEIQNKRMVMFMARQHPGEVWSSYMMEGVIKKLVSKEEDADIRWLLQNYIVIIYPMINIDGVIYGNFRCDITGVDLNRRWKDTPKLLHPQIHDIKKKIKYYRARAKVDCCYDLHGHSKNYNIFAYSCKENPYTCRILPLLISQRNPVFYFPSCTFGISKYKQTTARAAIYRIIKNQNVLTIESSFFASKLGGVVKEFNPGDLYQMAEDILYASRNFLDKKGKAYINAKRHIQTNIKQYLKYDEVNEFDSGSESDPEGDEIDIQTKISKIFDSNFVTRETLNLPIRETSQSMSPDKRFNKYKLSQEDLSIQGKNKKKSQLVNPHIIMKDIPLYKKPNNTIDHDKKILSSEINKKIIGRNGKKTISYSQQKNYETSTLDRQGFMKSKGVFRERQKKFSLSRPPEEQKSQRRFKDRRQKLPSQTMMEQHDMNDQMNFVSEEPQNAMQEARKSEQFVKRFEKFIPISMQIKNRANMNMFEQTIYNEDQSNLISMLLENKRKIELQKIKRDVQKSTYIVERQGKIKMSARKQKIVDFRTFKQNEKAHQQIWHRTRYDYFPQL